MVAEYMDGAQRPTLYFLNPNLPMALRRLRVVMPAEKSGMRLVHRYRDIGPPTTVHVRSVFLLHFAKQHYP